MFLFMIHDTAKDDSRIGQVVGTHHPIVYKSQALEIVDDQKGKSQNIDKANTSADLNPQLTAIAILPDQLVVEEIERLYKSCRSRFCREVFLSIWQWLSRTLGRKDVN